MILAELGIMITHLSGHENTFPWRHDLEQYFYNNLPQLAFKN